MTDRPKPKTMNQAIALHQGLPIQHSRLHVHVMCYDSDERAILKACQRTCKRIEIAFHHDVSPLWRIFLDCEYASVVAHGETPAAALASAYCRLFNLTWGDDISQAKTLDNA